MPLQELKSRMQRRRGELQSLDVVVLAGGGSSEREVSLASGNAVLAALDDAGYRVELLQLSPDGITLESPLAGSTALARLREAGMILSTMHGSLGENGAWQGMLELLGAPYVSAGVKGSVLAMDKLVSKRLFTQLGIPTPEYWVKRRGARFQGKVPAEVTELVAKPVDQGSSVGIELIANDDDGWRRIEEINQQYDPLLLERLINGVEVTAGVIGPLDAPVALPLVQIEPRRAFYDYTSKYTPGESEYLCPAPVDEQTVALIQGYAVEVYREFELAPFARIDLILDADGKPWFLEANTLPGFTPISLLPMAAKAAGVEFGELLEMLMLCALERWEEKNEKQE